MYVLICGSQNAIRISSRDKDVLIIMVNSMLITFFWVFPDLANWKSAVLDILRKYEPHQ